MVLANRPDHHTHTLIWCTGEREITKRARNEIGPATGTDDTLHRLFVYTWLCFNAANEYYLLFALLVILDVELTKRISNKYRENVLMVLWFIVEENLVWTHRYNNDDTGWRRWGRCDGQQFGVVSLNASNWKAQRTDDRLRTAAERCTLVAYWLGMHARVARTLTNTVEPEVCSTK